MSGRNRLTDLKSGWRHATDAEQRAFLAWVCEPGQFKHWPIYLPMAGSGPEIRGTFNADGSRWETIEKVRPAEISLDDEIKRRGGPKFQLR